MLLDQTNDLVCISRLGGIARLSHRPGECFGTSACKASLVTRIPLEERSVIVDAGLPAGVLTPQGWHYHPLPLNEFLGVHRQGLTSPEAVSLDAEEVVTRLG